MIITNIAAPNRGGDVGFLQCAVCGALSHRERQGVPVRYTKLTFFYLITRNLMIQEQALQIITLCLLTV